MAKKNSTAVGYISRFTSILHLKKAQYGAAPRTADAMLMIGSLYEFAIVFCADISRFTAVALTSQIAGIHRGANLHRSATPP